MATLEDRVSRLLAPGLIAVVRAPSAKVVPALTEALIRGGILAVEVTLTTPDPFTAIREACRFGGPPGIVGVGTVLNRDQCSRAIDAGAEFVVSPILRPELVGVSHAAGCPVMLGAYTPTEAQLAHEAGADFIKIFPADGLGPGYLRALRAPLPHLRMVPTGGVDLNTVGEFLKAGCAALGIGSSLLTKDILAREDWTALTELAARFVDKAAEVRR